MFYSLFIYVIGMLSGKEDILVKSPLFKDQY